LNVEYWNKHVEEASNPNELHRYKIILDMLPNKDIKILDVGCGTGFFEKLLWNRGYKSVIGLDWSENCLKIAKSKTPDYNYIRVNFEDKLPFKDNSFNTIVCLEVLEHVVSPLNLLKELLRVGKEIIISTPNGFWVELRLSSNKIFDSEHIHLTELTLKNMIHFLNGKVLEWKYYYGKFGFIRKILPRFLSSKFIVKISK